jgi:ribonuclease HI
MSRETVEIYTDGACKSNPGVGGWGALLRFAGREKELYGGEVHTTNNRMELTAVIHALQALKRPCHVKLHTDSQYVQKGVSEWLVEWKMKNWRTAGKKPVKNEDLWRQLDQLTAREGYAIDWIWVRAHAGHEFNERADYLANLGVKTLRQAG